MEVAMEEPIGTYLLVGWRREPKGFGAADAAATSVSGR